MIQSIMARLGLDTSAFSKGLNDAKNETKRFDVDLGAVMASAGRGIVAVVAAVAGLAVGFLALGKRAIESADNIKDMADALDLTAKSMQSFQAAFGKNGTSAQQFETGFSKFLDKLAEARNGSESAQETFQKLGLTLDDLANPNTEEIFFKVADGIKNSKNGADALNKSLDVFGKSGRQMSILMREGGEAVKAAMADAIAASDGAVANLANISDGITGIFHSMESLSIELVSTIVSGTKMLYDQVKPILDTFANFQVGGVSLKSLTAPLRVMIPKGGPAKPIENPESVEVKPSDRLEQDAKKAADVLAKARDEWTEAWEKQIEDLRSAFKEASSQFAQFNNQSSQSKGKEARDNRDAIRDNKQAEKRYGMNEKGDIENPEGAGRAIRDHERGRIRLSPEQLDNLKRVRDGTFQPDSEIPQAEPLKEKEDRFASPAMKEARKNQELKPFAGATAEGQVMPNMTGGHEPPMTPGGGASDLLSELQGIRTACEKVANMYGKST